MGKTNRTHTPAFKAQVALAAIKGDRTISQVAAHTPKAPVNRKGVQRLMRVMGLEALYCRPKTTVTDRDHKVYPYLLRNVVIARPNQVWSAEATHALVRDFRRRTGGWVMRLMTSDEYPVYAEVVRDAYGHRVIPPRTGRRGRPRQPSTTVAPGVVYAMVHKERENNRVVRVSPRVVFGAPDAAASAVSRSVNTCFVERHNGTDRNRCNRKVRKSYAFSKDWDIHRAATVFSYFSYNFCGPVRTLRVKGEGGREHRRWPPG